VTNDNPLLSKDRLLAVMTNQNEPNDVMAAALKNLNQKHRTTYRGVDEEQVDTDRILQP